MGKAELLRRLPIGIALALPLPAQSLPASRPAGDRWIPAAARRGVNPVPVRLERRTEEGLRFRHRLDESRELLRLTPGGAEEPVFRLDLGLELECRYRDPEGRLRPLDLQLLSLCAERRAGARHAVFDSGKADSIAPDAAAALAELMPGRLTARLGADGSLRRLSGSGLLRSALDRVRDEAEREPLAEALRALSLAEVELTLALLHPPVPAGELEPEAGFYRDLAVDLFGAGLEDGQLQHFYLGTADLGARRCAVFWSRLVLPAAERQQVRAGGAAFLVDRARVVAEGLRHVDLESGHCLGAGLSLTVDRTVRQGTLAIPERLRRRWELRTRAAGADGRN